MAKILDRRKQNSSKGEINRKRFLDRYKKFTKNTVDEAVKKYKLKDIKNHRKVKVPGGDVNEPTFSHDSDSGETTATTPGNKKFNKGDRIPKPSGGSGQGGQASDNGSGIDEFGFTLTKEEFVDILFENMSLPNYIKESFIKNRKFRRVPAGYTTDGTPAKLSLKKTFERSLARRFSAKGAIKKRIEDAPTEEEKERLKKKRVPFIDDEDLRYRMETKEPFPSKQAVMFCIMDVSGSMGEVEKFLSKQFYLLLYLFLEREYDDIDIVFIRYTHEAKEVDEDEFFYGKETGGTVTSSGYEVMLEVLEERYDLSAWNVYVAHTSDGDNFDYDNTKLLEILEKEVIPVVQYLVYVEIAEASYVDASFWGNELLSARLSKYFKGLTEKYEHVNVGYVTKSSDIYPVFRELFEGAPDEEK